MEFVIQKSVELGVRKIVPFLSKNCVSRPDKTDKKVERWRKIAAEAAKQCGRGYLPVVTAVESAEKAFAMASDSGTALFFYEHETRGLRETLEGQGVSGTVSLVVGPEGGFAPEEVQAAQNAGLSSVSLGTRILRCETAPVAALGSSAVRRRKYVKRGSVLRWQKAMWAKSQFLRKNIQQTRC